MGYDVKLQSDNKGQVRGYAIKRGNSIYKSSELGKGRSLTERENILRSEIFMKRWRTSAEVILNRMIEIEKYLTQ